MKCIAIICLAILLVPANGQAQSASNDDGCDVDDDPSCVSPVARALSAVGAYVSAPIHWGEPQWLEFSGALAAVGVAHAADTSVREHFAGPLVVGKTGSLQDALPATVLLVGTWGYAHVIGDHAGVREASTMAEATVLSLATAYVLNFAAGRQGPYETTHPNRWRDGGNSFPSEHTAAAFAIGTVLAESGNDDYRWERRLLGYGVGGFTLYERLAHNGHWLSDAVAGAALGTASAQFAMNRRNPDHLNLLSHITMEPLPHGWMLRYSVQLP